MSEGFWHGLKYGFKTVFGFITSYGLWDFLGFATAIVVSILAVVLVFTKINEAKP